jgi:hypothetical protein
VKPRHYESNEAETEAETEAGTHWLYAYNLVDMLKVLMDIAAGGRSFRLPQELEPNTCVIT